MRPRFVRKTSASSAVLPGAVGKWIRMKLAALGVTVRVHHLAWYTMAGEAKQEYPYFPDDAGEPYLGRRRKVGFDLYALYGVARNDIEGRKRAMLMNFEFFGAPVGLFFCMERKLFYGSWLDLGMFMQSVMVLARGHGLETCPQEAWNHYGPTVHKSVGIPDDLVIVSGMALGYEDKTAKANTLVTERVPVEQFTTFHS